MMAFEMLKGVITKIMNYQMKVNVNVNANVNVNVNVNANY